MALIKFDRMKELMDIPRTAEALLTTPEKEIKFSLNLKMTNEDIICFDAFVVYHNVVLGPAKGGIRFSPHVSFGEVKTFAEIMTYKNALMGLPFGGGKSGIKFDPYKMNDFTRIAIIKEYVHMIREELASGAYIPAPDLGSSPQDMSIIYGETHKPETVTGKPVIIGGLPGRLQATGRGVSHSAKLGIENILKKDIGKTDITVQGFGNVGRWTAYFLHKMGAKITAVYDIGGIIYNRKGIDIEKLFKYAPTSKDTIKGFPGAEPITADEFFSIESDVLIPAAVENVITDKTAPGIKARLIVEGANDPTTQEGEKILLEKGISVLPDFFANSGGVVASYFEWRNAKSGNQTCEKEVFELIDTKIDDVFWHGIEAQKKLKSSLREAFFSISLNTLIEAMKARLWI